MPVIIYNVHKGPLNILFPPVFKPHKWRINHVKLQEASKFVVFFNWCLTVMDAIEEVPLKLRWRLAYVMSNETRKLNILMV